MIGQKMLNFKQLLKRENEDSKLILAKIACGMYSKIKSNS